jgi:hypothetical protein
MGDSGLSDAGNWASIAAAVFAFLILLGGGVRWVRLALARRRAARRSRTDYGMVDYLPEFMAAVRRYNGAQAAITKEMGSATEVFEKNENMSSQEEAAECAEAANGLSDTYEELLPVLAENSQIMDQCLRGFLKIAKPTNAAEVQELRELHENVRYARQATAGYLRSIRSGKRTIAQLRGRNISASLNESSARQQRHLRDASRTIKHVVVQFRAAERRIGRRLIVYSFLVRG